MATAYLPSKGQSHNTKVEINAKMSTSVTTSEQMKVEVGPAQEGLNIFPYTLTEEHSLLTGLGIFTARKSNVFRSALQSGLTDI